MKTISTLALAILFLCTSCRKVQDYNPAGGNTTYGGNLSASVENLGHPFTGNNVMWKIHPLNPNNSPLFTHSPYSDQGYCMVMLDCGEVDGRTPLGAFRFVVVDLQTSSTKIVDVKGPEGEPINSSLGRIVRYVFGMDKKLYVCTEGSAGGGGHLIQYDPNTQTAKDLGKPFRAGTGYLDIYTLNTGTDGALYGGSFGGEGQVYTFRYDYSELIVDQTPLDNSSRYVTAVSGDSRYTYAVCGKTNWFLYAVDRQTGEKRTLKCNAGSAIAMGISSNTDAPYAQSQATHYELTGFDCAPLAEYHTPKTQRVLYVPYTPEQDVPQVSWNPSDKTISYTSSTLSSGTISVSGIIEDTYATIGPSVYTDNTFYFSSEQQGMLGAYSAGQGVRALGNTSMSLHTMAVPFSPGADAGKIFMGGYPKGQLLEYSPAAAWSVNTNNPSDTTGGGFATVSSNPQQKTMFQNPDASGVYGSMILLGSTYTKSGYLAAAGNNDRITASTGRELSMGSYRNGSVRNLYLPEFSNYEFRSMCISADSNAAFVCALPHAGDVAKLYKYDPSSNQVTGSWNLPLWGDRVTSIKALGNDLIVGYCEDVIYLFDLSKGEIIWKKALGGSGKKVYAIALDDDNSIFITHMENSQMNYKIEKYNLDVTNRSNILSTATEVAAFSNMDNDMYSRPTGLLVAPGSSEIYVTGLLSLYRVSL